MNPLVSIVIPAYNAEKWIESAVRSALAQSWANIEVIVVDDGSTDGTQGALSRISSPKLKVLRQENGGASRARNTGLGQAQGTYIQYLDADDLLAFDKIEHQMAVLEQHGENVLSSSSWGRFESDPAQAVFTPMPNWRDMTGVEFLQLHYETTGMMQPAAWLASRALLDRAGPWNETLSLNDDGEYFARVMLAADRIVFAAHAKSFYRSHQPASLSGRKDRAALESLYESVRLTTSYLLDRDNSPRTHSAVAHAWKWTAFELYPGAPDLSKRAEENSDAMGGSSRPFPGSGRFQLATKLFGWRVAKRLLG